MSKLRPGVSDLNDQISIDRRETIASFRNLGLFRRYAMGRQDTTLTIDQQKMLEGVLGNEFCDNICGQVLAEHANRLELERVTAKQDTIAPESTGNLEGKDDDGKPLGQKEQEWIDAFWQRAKIDDLQARVHRNTIRDGNYCLMVTYDPERKRIVLHREPWWDGYMGVFIGYDTYGNMLYAVKEWDTPEGRRRTIYYDGAVERYLASGGGNIWTPFILPEDNVMGVQPGALPGSVPVPIPYVDGDGEPMHIPFVHFTNPSDEFENYGSSIFDGGKIGMQDQINDVQYDIAAAARMNGYQRTWSKGYKLQKINGKTVRPKTGPGVHYHSEEKDASWGVLEAGDTSQLINVYKIKVESFCRNTHTPYATITGNWPSGEALYRQEKPLYGATKARQRRLSPCWVEVIHRAIELANVYDNEGLNEDVMLTAVYSDAGDRDPLNLAMADQAFWQAAEFAVQAGMPLATFLKVAGWGEDEINGLTADIEEQIAQRQADLDNTSPDDDDEPPSGSGGSNASTNRGQQQPPTKQPTRRESTTTSTDKTPASKRKTPTTRAR